MKQASPEVQQTSENVRAAAKPRARRVPTVEDLLEWYHPEHVYRLTFEKREYLKELGLGNDLESTRSRPPKLSALSQAALLYLEWWSYDRNSIPAGYREVDDRVAGQLLLQAERTRSAAKKAARSLAESLLHWRARRADSENMLDAFDDKLNGVRIANLNATRVSDDGQSWQSPAGTIPITGSVHREWISAGRAEHDKTLSDNAEAASQLRKELGKRFIQDATDRFVRGIDDPKAKKRLQNRVAQWEKRRHERTALAKPL